MADKAGAASFAASASTAASAATGSGGNGVTAASGPSMAAGKRRDNNSREAVVAAVRASTDASQTQKGMEDLMRLVMDRQRAQVELAELERKIAKRETAYLVETQAYGNLFKGWRGYLATKERAAAEPKKLRRPRDHERLFSTSSVSSPTMIQEAVRDVQNPGVYKKKKRKKKDGY